MAIEESNKENSKTLVDTINDLKDSLEKQSTMINITGKKWTYDNKPVEIPENILKDGFIEQSLRAKDEICKAAALELHEYSK